MAETTDVAKLHSEILDQMMEVEDPNYRAVLGLLIKSDDLRHRRWDEMDRKIEDRLNAVDRKLDEILRDEERLRMIVLNGHVEVHDAHHRWVNDKMDVEKTARNNANRAKWDTISKILAAILMMFLGYTIKSLFDTGVL